MSANDLISQKSRALQQARAVASSAEFAAGDSEAERSYQRHVADARRLSVEIDTSQSRAKLGGVIWGAQGGGGMTVRDTALDAEIRSALDPRSAVSEFTVAAPNRQFRASELYTGDTKTTYSSYLFTNQMYPQILKHLNDASAVLEAGATIITTDHLRPITIPVLLTDAASQQTDELVPATQTYPVFDKITLLAWRQDGLFIFSEEMRLASEYDIQGLLADSAGRALATQVAKLLATGAGTSTPAGIALATPGVTCASKVVATCDEVIACVMSLDRPYQRLASLIVSSGLYLQMLQWKDDSGMYLLKTIEGGGETFMGKRLFVEPQLADPAQSAVTAVAGDFSRVFVRMSPISFEIDKSVYFSSFCLVARFAVWMDSSPLVDAKALRGLKMSA